MSKLLLLSLICWSTPQISLTHNPLVFGTTHRPSSFGMTRPFDHLRQAILDDPPLAGAWVVRDTAPADALDQYLIRIIVDKRHSERQTARIRELVRKTLPDRSARIAGIVELPLSELIARLNTRIESHRALDGCHVEGAYYVRSRFGFELCVLYGRVVSQEQRYRITDLCGSLMSEFPEWRKAVDKSGSEVLQSLNIAPDVAGRELVVTASNSGLGRKFYGEGQHAFWDRRYDDALRAFHLATIESPSQFTYRYWRVLAELRSGQTEDAYNHLAATWRRASATPVEMRQVVRSLERVQGPIRMRLVNMEFHARAHDTFHEVRGRFASSDDFVDECRFP